MNIETAKSIVKTCLTFAIESKMRLILSWGGSGLNLPATVILSAPTFPFAVKLTTFRPKATVALTRRITMRDQVRPPEIISEAPEDIADIVAFAADPAELKSISP